MHINLKQALLLSLIVIAILGAGGSYYFYQKYNTLKANPNLEVQKETQTFVTAVGKLMELPKDETPTIATISDKEKLKDQPFFKAVENGDILLAYTKAQKAILYRPITNKIIEVAPINLNANTTPSPTVEPGSAATTNDIKVEYYNGTLVAGLSGNAEKIMKERFSNFKTVALSHASKTDYKETIVVDLSGTHAQEAAEAAKLLNGKVAPIPAGEVRPDADILIISGQ